jgi:ketol-acid reductoisomerase
MRPFQNIWMILSLSHFSKTMMEDWDNDDQKSSLESCYGDTNFEKTPAGDFEISETSIMIMEF